jgi:hypothetical protein
MRNQGWRRTLVGLCLLTLPGLAPAQAQIRWEKSLDTARARARKSSRLIMVDFYADW